jgi:DNA polymerase III alpha subunit
MFVPLRLHSVFSKGKGGLTVGEAAGWAGSKGLPAAALTDIANFYGWGKWKKTAAEKERAAVLKMLSGQE